MNWSAELDREIRRIAGPLDDLDPEVNSDPDSLTGDDDESGFDDMPIAAGWDDESEDDEEEGEDDGDEC